jgi:hypothetical protein
LALARNTKRLLHGPVVARLRFSLTAALVLFLGSFLLSLWLEEDIQGMRVMVLSSKIFGTIWVAAIFSFFGSQTKEFQTLLQHVWRMLLRREGAPKQPRMSSASTVGR